jgi:hypothetical protein
VLVLSEKGIEEDFREARSVCDEDCRGLEEKCEAPWYGADRTSVMPGQS